MRTINVLEFGHSPGGEVIFGITLRRGQVTNNGDKNLEEDEEIRFTRCSSQMVR